MGPSERSRVAGAGPQGAAEIDGGRRGLVAVLALWSRHLAWVGATKGLGIMLPVVQEQMDTQTWVIGWITAGIPAVGGLVCEYSFLAGKSL